MTQALDRTSKLRRSISLKAEHLRRSANYRIKIHRENFVNRTKNNVSNGYNRETLAENKIIYSSVLKHYDIGHTSLSE